MGKPIVVVTGVKISEAQRIFPFPGSATVVEYQGTQYKMNAAAGVASYLSQNGYTVCATAKQVQDLHILCETGFLSPVFAEEVDLLNKSAVVGFMKRVERLKSETGQEVHAVHYGGASETDVKLKGNTVFLHPREVPAEAVGPIVMYSVGTGYNVYQALAPIFDTQQVSKFIGISAITAVRTKRLHSLDAAQKGAFHAWMRSLALDLVPERIYVTEVMPGITDTSFYDNETTFEAIKLASRELGYEYDEETFPLICATAIGKTVQFVLESENHVREIPFMPYGQYPHLGA